MKLRGLLPLMLLLGSVALAARAQVCSADAALRRTLPVNVLDAQGNLVRGLTAGDFRGGFRGHPVTILSVAADTAPRRILVLLNVSQDTYASPDKVEVALWLAEDIVRFGPADSSIGLATFSQRIEERLEFSPEGNRARAMLGRLRSNKHKETPDRPRAALFDVLLEAVDYLNPASVGDVVYLVSDSNDWESRSNKESLEQAFASTGVRLFSASLPDFVGTRYISEGPYIVTSAEQLAGILTRARRMATDSPGFDRLLELAGATGGALFKTGGDGGNGVTGVRELYRLMAEFYRVEVELPQGVDKARDWKLEVVDAKGKRRKDLQVVYPRKLVPCAEPADEREAER